ncbi:MAG TPA: hypothetical protein VLI46_03420 [Ramlibacter sp.]|nr:hypothetical protein [Ramlibacter sp.]
MASIDTRGFRYALEPLRKRSDWQLDTAIARVAAVRTQLEAARTAQQELEARVIAQARLAQAAWQKRGDPGTQSSLLSYLAGLQGQKARADAEIATLEGQLARARQAALEKQQEVDMLRQHRDQELDAYRVEQVRKSSAEADQDWSARRSPVQEEVE